MEDERRTTATKSARRLIGTKDETGVRKQQKKQGDKQQDEAMSSKMHADARRGIGWMFFGG